MKIYRWVCRVAWFDTEREFQLEKSPLLAFLAHFEYRDGINLGRGVGRRVQQSPTPHTSSSSRGWHKAS